MTRAKFIMDILEYLERIKHISLTEHGVKITSATISRPPWAHDYGDLFDEACLLADIEVLEQPRDRVSIATKFLTEDMGPVLVLDHADYGACIEIRGMRGIRSIISAGQCNLMNLARVQPILECGPGIIGGILIMLRRTGGSGRGPLRGNQ